MHLSAEKFEIVPNEPPVVSLRRELLDTVKNVEEIDKEREIVANLAEKNKTIQLDAAFVREKDRKSGDPTNPNSPFANFIRMRAAEFLDLPDEDAFKFYSAASASQNKTVLERDYKIDAFFELEREEGNIIVPINLTIRPEENSNALVYVLSKDFPIHGRFSKGGKGEFAGLSEGEEILFNKSVAELGKKIAGRFKHLIEIEKQSAVNETD